MYYLAELIFLASCFIHSDCKKYYNYTLYRGIPVNERQLSFFKNMTELYDEVKFWRLPGTVNFPIDFVIGPEDKAKFKKDSDLHELYVTTVIEDVQSAFDRQIIKPYVSRRMESFDWRSFYKLDDIYSWLEDLQKTYPQVVNLTSIGRTFENRDIMCLKLKLNGAQVRSTVIVEGGIHAREWISPAFVTYMINELVHAPHSNQPELKKLSMAYEWHFVPVLNPDGYHHTHAVDRVWRKNRQPKGQGIIGVDLNRNFGVAFGTASSSKNGHDDTYCGEKPFSEKETTAMANYVHKLKDKLEYYLSFHSYGQYMIVPYAYSYQHWDNYDEVTKMCREAAKIVSQNRGTQYKYGTAFDTIGYVTSGVSGCWVKKMYRVPYVITFELPDDGTYGFALPTSEILPICEELMKGIVHLLTPKAGNPKKLNDTLTKAKSRQEKAVLDKLVFFCYILLLITVC